ncbi:MAG TPA: substrate-binding domain-containing protein [Thermodesulfobacteriota bacterium]
MYRLPRMLLLLLAAACSLAAPASALSESIAVIVHRDNPQRALSRDEIRRIYTNSVLEWPDGTPVAIYDLSVDDPVREVFSGKVLRKAPSKVAQEWAHLKITNQAKNPPTAVKSESIIIRRIAREKGAIGYVSLSSVEGNPDVRIVNTIQ